MHELFEPTVVAVEPLVERLSGEFDLVLGLPGLQRLGQLTPEPVEPLAAHLEEPADVGGTLFVEECRRLGAVAIAAIRTVAIAFEESQRDEGIEEVVGRPRVKSQPFADFLARHRLSAEVAEQVQLHRRQQRLRRTNSHADIHNVGRIQLNLRHLGRAVHMSSYVLNSSHVFNSRRCETANWRSVPSWKRRSLIGSPLEALPGPLHSADLVANLYQQAVRFGYIPSPACEAEILAAERHCDP